jgi:hypothetical protein
MKNILVINDNSAAATHAAEFALTIAQMVKANILLANTVGVNNKAVVKVPSGDFPGNIFESTSKSEMLKRLLMLKKPQNGFMPLIEEFDNSTMDESKLADFINKNQIWMMVKGMADESPAANAKRNLNAHLVLNKVLCPLLLVPENWRLKPIERIAYIADLRYCRKQIVHYLTELAKPWKADLSIAHLTAKGLPDMDEKYALCLFSHEVCSNINYDRLFFNHVKEKDFATVVDVMINGMHNDMLVLVNHHFHIEEILGRYITDKLPEPITIPLFIFPY